MYYEIVNGNSPFRGTDERNCFPSHMLDFAEKEYNKRVKWDTKNAGYECHYKLIEIDGGNERVIKEFIKPEPTEQQKQELREIEARKNAKCAQQYDAKLAKARAKTKERAEAQAQKKYEEKISNDAFRASNGNNPYSPNIEKVKKQGNNDSPPIISGAEQGYSL